MITLRKENAREAFARKNSAMLKAYWAIYHEHPDKNKLLFELYDALKALPTYTGTLAARIGKNGFIRLFTMIEKYVGWRQGEYLPLSLLCFENPLSIAMNRQYQLMYGSNLQRREIIASMLETL